MSDFYQHRLVTTLHQLADPNFDDQQEQLKRYTKDKPITLVMPALYSEVEGPALPGILDHLEKVEFINEVVISMNRMDSDQFKKAKEFFSRLPQKHFIIWNDGPRVSEIYNELKEAQRIDQMLQPLHKSLFMESNPAPVKYAAKLLGLCDDEIRLPLVKIKKETQEEVKKALSSAKLIS